MAMVSSTTPRFGPRWPPFFARTLMSSSRISAASCSSCQKLSCFTSAGERMPSSSCAISSEHALACQLDERFSLKDTPETAACLLREASLCYTRGMPDFAAPVERLIDELKHLPGIGQKTAAPGLPSIAGHAGGGPFAGRSHPRCQGKNPLVHRLLQPHRFRSLYLLHRPHTDQGDDLRRGGST